MSAGEPITLREYVESRLVAVEATIARDIVTVRELQAAHAEAHEREHRAQETAIRLADDAMTVRLEGMNEFRRQLDRERGSYVTGDRLEDKIGPLVGRLDALERAQSNLAGRMAAAGIGLTILMFAIGVALRFIH